VSSTKANIDALKAAATADPTLEVSINVKALTVTAGGLSFAVEMPDSARHALLSGKYDPIKELMDNKDKIEATAASLSYVG
jgi:3-isopropylmalate/(R)-2-methylmalate dehydratase small subunit